MIPDKHSHASLHVQITLKTLTCASVIIKLCMIRHLQWLLIHALLFGIWPTFLRQNVCSYYHLLCIGLHLLTVTVYRSKSHLQKLRQKFLLLPGALMVDWLNRDIRYYIIYLKLAKTFFCWLEGCESDCPHMSSFV